MTTQPQKQLIDVKVIIDVVCPWCYIGKRRIEEAMRRTSDRYDFKIQFLPYQLNPAASVPGTV
jgi:predicted DsbA family dithiol-disulfide isomerase